MYEGSIRQTKSNFGYKIKELELELDQSIHKIELLFLLYIIIISLFPDVRCVYMIGNQAISFEARWKNERRKGRPDTCMFIHWFLTSLGST